MQDHIAAPYRLPAWNLNPATNDEWRCESRKMAQTVEDGLPSLRERLGVVSEAVMVGGIRAWLVKPSEPGLTQANRLLVHAHGGGYVYSGGEAGTLEAILMAAVGGFEVLSFDYRLAYDMPYPAAMDDAVAVWKAALAMQPPQNMAIFGTSTGGAMTLSMVLRARDEGLPLPAAIACGSPFSDLTETGDSYKTNEWLDNIEISYHGFLCRAACLYAGSHDMKDPQLSPVYGDYTGAPPTILLSGTRDLFLSNTVRVHRRMREAGVDAQLHVFEGQSHAAYMLASHTPEMKVAYGEIAAFFKAHLGQ